MFDLQPRVIVYPRAQAGGDHEGGATVPKADRRFHYHDLGLHVDGAGGFVEDVLEESPGERDALALAPERRMPRSPTWVS